jgi:hypothetical protein
MTTEQVMDDQDSGPELRLLRDIRLVFETTGHTKLPTVNLLEGLRHVPESEWGEIDYGQPALNTYKLATMLKPYAVKPKRMRVDDGQQVRGYYREDFEDVWSRYGLNVTDGDLR